MAVTQMAVTQPKWFTDAKGAGAPQAVKKQQMAVEDKTVEERLTDVENLLAEHGIKRR